MTRYIKEGTATELAIGPFVDSIDGVTAETGLTISNTDVRIKIGAADWAAATNGGTHEENGWYRWTIAAGEALVGPVVVSIQESGAMPVWHEFMVLADEAYDAIVAGTGNGLRADAVAISGDTAAADLLELFAEASLRTSGTAQSGTASTIRLSAGDGAANGVYADHLVVILAGTGIGQVRRITAYASATKDATVSPDWTITPDNTSQYAIISGGRVTLTATTISALLAAALGAESYAADGSVPTLEQALYMIYSAVAQFDISGTQLTTRKLDGTTQAMVFTLDDATNPTSRVRTA